MNDSGFAGDASSPLFGHAREGLFVHDLEGNILEANEPAVVQSGYSREELLQRTVFDLHPQSSEDNLDRSEIIAHWQRWVVGQSVTLKAEHQRKDGSVYPVTVCSSKIALAGKEYIIALVTETIARQEAEEDVAKRSQLLTKLSQQVPGAIYQYRYHPDGAAYFPFASDGIWNIYEVRPDDIQDDAAAVFARIHPDDYDRVVASVHHSFHALNVWEEEYRVLLPERGLRWVRGLARPEKLADDSVLWHGYLTDVSEIKATEKALQESKSRYKALVANVPGVVFRCKNDPDWTMEFIDRKIADISGYSATEFTENGPKSYASLIYSEDKDRVSRTVQECVTQGQPYSLDYRIVHADGSLRWVNENAQGVFSGQGQLLHLYGVITDVTEQKEMELALRESEEKFRQITENMGEVFWLRSADNRQMIYVNPAYELVWGRSRDSLYRNPDSFLDAVYGADKAAVSAEFSRYEQTNRFNLEFRIVRPTGDLRWVQARSFPVKDANGTVVRHTGLAMDITKRKQAEEESMATTEKLNIYLEQAPYGILVMDANGNCCDVNEEACRVTGYSRQELLTMNVLKLIPRDARLSAMRQFRHRSTEQEEHASERIELPLLRKDGNRRMLGIKATKLSDIRYLGFVEDITEQKQAAAEIAYLSFHDSLTGLYNRRFYEEELKRLDVPRNLPLSLVLIDVNGLKLSNDAFGHKAGDALLRKAAEILRKCCRADDIVARVGGDEFAVLLPKTSHEQAESQTQRVRRAVASQTVTGLPLSLACGWATKTDPTTDIGAVFKEAEDYMYRDKVSEQNSFRHQTIQMISQALYAKSPREQRHAQRVSQLSGEIGAAMGLGQGEINDLVTAGLLHDIGKIAISEGILEKSLPLTDAEWMEIKRHPDVGFKILGSASDYSRLADCVLSHHEHWDGGGYPNGLQGKEIPVCSRIITVADAWDAMVSSRPYRRGLDRETALREIVACAGSQFDPQIVKTFVELMQSKDPS